MYLKFYGLTEKPFNQTPDPKFLYWNDSYREALASLRYGIQERKGFLSMIGEAGTGKTTLLRKLLDDLGSDVVSVFLFNPNASFEEILEYTLSELGISVPSGRKLAMLQRLNEFLLAAFAEGRNTILVIDEAQDLETEVLESLRLLSNLETSKEKILQIVLSGQPELAARLAQDNLRQLKQRIAVRCRLEPLQRSELAAFLCARLGVAGGAEDLFADGCLDPIWAFSHGIPRLVNTVCDNALLVGYAMGKRRIDREVVLEVVADLGKLDIAPLGSPGSTPPQGTSLQVPAGPPRVAEPPVAPRPPDEGVPVLDPGVRPPPLAANVPLVTPREADIPPAAPAVAPAPHGARLPTESAGPSPAGDTRSGTGPSETRSGRGIAIALGLAVAVVGAGVWVGARDRAPLPVPGAADRSSAAPHGANAAASRSIPPAAAVEGVPIQPPIPAEAPPPKPAPEAAPQDTSPSDRGPDPLVGEGTSPHPGPQPRVRPVDVAAVAAREDLPVAPESGARAHVVPGEQGPGLPAPAIPSSGAPGVGSEAGVVQDVQDSRSDALRPGRRVLVRPGDTLFELASRTYGGVNFTTLDMLRAANPGIEDLDRIPAGGTLVFPEPGPEARILGDRATPTVLAITTPTEEQARSVQRKLQEDLHRKVDVERIVIGVGRPLYRVSVRDLQGEPQAKDIARSLGSILQDPSESPGS